MMNMTAKVSFELTEEGRVTIEVNGNPAAVKAGLLSLAEKIAELEKVSIEDYIAEMKEAVEFSKKSEDEKMDVLLSKILEMGGEEEDSDCDGDCDNCDRHEEMPAEMKEFFDKVFGGLN